MDLVRRRVHAVPDALHIMGEVSSGRLQADGIVLDPWHHGDGWKGRAKSRATNFILRALRKNLHLQRAFNHMVVDVLQLIAEDLCAHEKRLPAARDGENGPPVVSLPHAERD